MGKSDRRRAPKRARSTVEDDVTTTEPHNEMTSWVTDDVNAPFGLVPAAMQSYFKEVNAQLLQMMQGDDTEGKNEEKQMLLQAILNEMDKNELMLATDPTCSLVMENMASQLDEKPLRVLLDRMTGRFVLLLTTAFVYLHHIGMDLMFSSLCWRRASGCSIQVFLRPYLRPQPKHRPMHMVFCAPCLRLFAICMKRWSHLCQK